MSQGLKPDFGPGLMSGLKPGPISEATTTAISQQRNGNNFSEAKRRRPLKGQSDATDSSDTP